MKALEFLTWLVSSLRLHVRLRALPALALVGALWSPVATATPVITIDRGNDRAVPVAVVPFRWAAGLNAPESLDEIISFDLARSGRFAPIARDDMLSYPTAADEVHFRDWRVQGTRWLVIGRLQEEAPGRFAATYELYDVLGERRVAMETLRGSKDQLRDIAHVAADAIFQKITNIRGAFATRMLYVLAQRLGTPNARFSLQMSDSDGARSRTLLQLNAPIMSPNWSPDATKIAYVTFETGRSAIYLHNLGTGARERIAAFPGINSSPTFSPDGRTMAMVLSKDRVSAEIYLMDVASRRLRQLTRNTHIDTEPSWMSAGRRLVYTSNQGGKPQIYGMDVATGLSERMTFVGDYNARPRALPDGRSITYVHRLNPSAPFNIAVLNLEDGRNSVISQTKLDESPSVAPNGTMLVYATLEGGKGILAHVSIDGRARFRLPSAEGDVREPAWSPYLNVRSRLQ